MGPRKHYLPLAGLLAAVIGVQLAASATASAFYLTQLTMAAYYCLLIIGLCVLMGYTGQISLGHAGFFAIGGYLSAALTSHDFAAAGDTLIMRALDRAGLPGAADQACVHAIGCRGITAQ